MTSSLSRTPVLTLAVLALLGLPACALGGHTNVTLAASLNCGELIPARLRAPVEPAPLPEGNTVGNWVSFADATVARFEISEDRRATVLEIVDGCEKVEAATAASLAPRTFWQRLTPWR